MDDMSGESAEEWKKLNEKAKKYRQLFNFLDKCLFLEQGNKIDFKGFLEKEKICSIAIYGMASLGKHLFMELRKENIAVSFGIDRYVGQFGNDLKIYCPEEPFLALLQLMMSAASQSVCGIDLMGG